MNAQKAMYFKLFNRITDMIESLQQMQQEMEEMYLSAEEDTAEEPTPVLCAVAEG